MNEIQQEAEQLEKNYDWLGAAKSYEKALTLLPKDDFSRTGDCYEQLGHSLFRFAFQAETKDEFNDRLRQSAVAYEKSIESYGKPKESVKTANILRCKAMIAYVGYWLAQESHDKKTAIDECWKLTSQSLEEFEDSGEHWEYSKTFNQLSRSADLSFCLEWNSQTREKVIREATKCGELAITYLSALNNDNELAKAYVKTADYLYALSYAFLSREDQEKKFEKARDYWQKAKQVCEEAAVLEALSILQGLMLEFETGAEETLSFYQRALEYGKKTADRFIVGRALDMLAYHMHHKAWSMTEDPDEMVKLGEAALEKSEETKKQYTTISFVGPGGYGFLWAEEPRAEYYCILASKQTDPNKTHDLAKKAAEAGPSLLKRAENSGYPDAFWYAHHVMGKVLALLARIETDPEAKTRLLQEALQHRNEVFKSIQQVAPSMYWERGIALVGMGESNSQLADLTSDSETKMKLLLEAAKDEQESFNLLAKGIVSLEKKDSMITILGYTQYQRGLLLNRLYESTRNKEHLTRAAEAFDEAANYYGKFELAERVAESQWKTAQAYDALDEHLKSAEHFDLASDNYNKAAEKVPQLREFYHDHAHYMQAWSEIEKARHDHQKQQFGQAMEHFEKAAALHLSLKRWNYLAPNYSAWALVENAEELSRKEQSQEAINAFDSASKMFAETKKTVQKRLNIMEDSDEKKMATSIIKASGLRQEYCDARINLEEAKILDKQGDHFGSSAKYGAAAHTFQRIRQNLESEREQKEFKSTIALARAWEKMMLGDAKASPESYLEASALFEEASRESNSEVTSLLALGHSRFCKALEAGTRFADTGDTMMQTVAMQNLESASKYYVKAGFQSASEYAKATSLLFEAYVHMDTAKGEKDPEKKAKLYTIAEKVLQTCAGAFMKAEHPEKREQVLRLLEKVREERELALSIAEVLHAPSIVSTTASLSTLAPTSEEAVGAERFEHADIQANLIIRNREVRIGESLTIEVELVNAGKGSALLTKITDIVPKGFVATAVPETCRLEEGYINLKGRRLDPLKSEEVRLVLKPSVQGTFSLRPAVLYLDENGKYKSFELEPTTIVVKELGMKGWLKGER